MLWAPRKETTGKFSLHYSAFYYKLCRHARKRIVKSALLGIFMICLWIKSSLSAQSSQSRAGTWWPSNNSLFDFGRNTTSQRSTVGKVHAVFGEPNPIYERSLQLHEAHSFQMGHPMFILRERILSGLWSKPAYVLAIILQELSKPEDVRLKWLLYVTF